MNRCTSGLRSLIDADAVGVDDRVRDRPVLDDAAVDEDVLRTARRPLLGERRDVAGHAQPAGFLSDLEEIAPLAVDLIQPIAQRRRRRTLQHLAPGARQREADLRIRQRELRDDARHLRRLGAVGLQELAPRRQVVEQVVDLDDGAFGGADLDDRRDRAAVDADLGAALRARARVRRTKCETDAIDGSASPRKPSVRMAARSSARRILLVAWRSIASRASSGSIPSPSSSTRTCFLPPSST